MHQTAPASEKFTLALISLGDLQTVSPVAAPESFNPGESRPCNSQYSDEQDEEHIPSGLRKIPVIHRKDAITM
jgi:hypothetical protein